MLYGITKASAYRFAQQLKEKQVFNQAVLFQPNLTSPWYLTFQNGALANLQRNENITLSFNANELAQFKTIKEIANFIYLKAAKRHYDQEAISIIFHTKFRFEMLPSQSQKYPDLIKIWKMKPNNTDRTRYLFDATIPELTKKLVTIKNKISYKYPSTDVFDIDLLITNNNIKMVLAPNGYEKYFTSDDDIINYCLMYAKK